MTKKITREQKKRARHPGTDADGVCTRCSLAVDPDVTDDFCPPGFWMNAAEVAAWTRGERIAGV